MLNYVRYTDAFCALAEQYISECIAKRKEILDADKDTANETALPNFKALVEDVLSEEADENGLCFSCWGVTDNYDSDRLFVSKQTLAKKLFWTQHRYKAVERSPFSCYSPS